MWPKYIEKIPGLLYQPARRLSLFGLIAHRIRLIRLEHTCTEGLLLQNKHKNINNCQSIVFFTTHKCASGFVGDILKRLIESAGMTNINYERYFYWLGAKVRKPVYKEKGYFFGPFRRFHNDMPDFDNYKVVLMLRDPRDVLTSFYFSMAYSHNTNCGSQQTINWVVSNRKKALEMGIDKFVLDRLQEYLDKYTLYCNKFLSKPNVLFVRYEDMVNDFVAWLNKIIEFLELDIKKEVADKIMSKTDFSVKKENIYFHKRQVTPGDYRQKLKPETISILNEQFKEILELLGYAHG